MTELDLDTRRRRIRIRAWRRGMREMDLILGGFADAHLADLTEAEIAEFEKLLDESDRDVYSWISGELPIPEDANGPLLKRVIAAQTHAKPPFD